MELTQEQSLGIIVRNMRAESYQYRYKFTAKIRWYCLSCLKIIYVSFEQYGINSIFCKKCHISYRDKPTIVQFQYMRILKERQIKLAETFIQ